MDRNYAYIRITGTDDCSEITEALGLNPTEAWNVGDLRKNGTEYDFSNWSYESQEFENEFIDDCIEAVIDFIHRKRLNLKHLPGDFIATIQCVGHHRFKSLGFHLSKELVEKLGAIGLSVDFDLYCHVSENS